MKNIFASLMNAQLESFRVSFKNTAAEVFYDEDGGRLIHPGEYGQMRESAVRELLSNFLPEIYGVSQGFVIGQNENEISQQCDIIVYDKEFTPLFHTPENQRFFPVESIVAVGEVKSEIGGTELDDAFKKLTKIKCMREKIVHSCVAKSREKKFMYEPHNDCRDQVLTFLIGEKFKCTDALVSSKIKEPREDCSARHRVNMIATMDDKTILYERSGFPYMYPVVLADEEHELPICSVTPKQNNAHLALFFRYLLLGIEDVTILYPELTEHFKELLIYEMRSI